MNTNFYRCAILLILVMLPSVLSAQVENPLKGKYILVLDVQEIATRKTLEPDVARQLINNVNRVISLADPEKVIYVEAIMAKLVISLSGLDVEVEDGMKLDDRLKLVNDIRVVKTKASAFTAEALKDFIEIHQANEFVLVGLMAEHCVKATALEGREKGFNIAIVPEAVASESAEGKTEVINLLSEKGVEIIPLAKL